MIQSISSRRERRKARKAANATYSRVFMGDSLTKLACRLSLFGLLPPSLSAAMIYCTQGFNDQVALRIKAFFWMLAICTAVMIFAAIKRQYIR